MSNKHVKYISVTDAVNMFEEIKEGGRDPFLFTLGQAYNGWGDILAGPYAPGEEWVGYCYKKPYLTNFLSALTVCDDYKEKLHDKLSNKNYETTKDVIHFGNDDLDEIRATWTYDEKVAKYLADFATTYNLLNLYGIKHEDNKLYMANGKYEVIYGSSWEDISNNYDYTEYYELYRNYDVIKDDSNKVRYHHISIRYDEFVNFINHELNTSLMIGSNGWEINLDEREKQLKTTNRIYNIAIL